MQFTAFDVPTTTELTDLMENLTALAAGTGINAGALLGSKFEDGSIPFAKLTNKAWEELGRTTLGVAGDTISVTSLPARDNLMIIVACFPTGGTINGGFRFNNDSGTNYARRFSDNGAADSTATSGTNIPMDSGAVAAYPFFCVANVTNISSLEKVLNFFVTGTNTAGASNVPVRRESIGKWTNTSSQISRVDVINPAGTGDFAIGSVVIVLGKNN